MARPVLELETYIQRDKLWLRQSQRMVRSGWFHSAGEAYRPISTAPAVDPAMIERKGLGWICSHQQL
jgi:hypothetical protein